MLLSSLQTVSRPTASALLAVVLAMLLLPINLALADTGKKGVLDIPAAVPTTGSASEHTASTSDLKQEMAALKSELKAERKRLKKLKRSALTKLARSGERAAQLVLAENYAEEANQESVTIISANDAMSDAAFWYNLAARRGFPGSPNVDGTLPLFPLRSVRGPN